MKKINIVLFVSGFIFAAAMLGGCGGKGEPGRTYMPDMAYSRAYETYSLHDTTLFTTEAAKRGGNIIFYNSMPVQGTMKRGELYPYSISNDTIGYKMSASVKNPLDTVKFSMTEAGRLYNINCGICHGEKGAANGPLATSGKVGGVANIATGEKAALSDGTIFHVMTYGKGVMGSYAAQLTREQRWQIVKYIRTLQSGDSKAGADSTAKVKADSSAAVSKAKAL